MALLNKLFFPSTTTSAPAAAAASSKSAWTSFTSATASLSSSSGTPTTATTAVTTAPTSAPTCVNKRSSNNNNQSVHSKNYLSQFPFDGRQVRVLLYRECDGRRLLFDSNALEKVPLKEANCNITPREKSHHHHTQSSSGGCGGNKYNKHSINGSGSSGGGGSCSSSSSAYIEVCEEYGYRHNRPTSDDIMKIGEMVFGASAMSFRGTAFKIHWLEEPSRILCSQVFLTPISSSSSTGNGPSPYSTISMNSLATPRTSISSEHGSVDGLSMNSFSMPCSVNVGRHLSLTPSERGSIMITCPLDMPRYDQQSMISANSSDSGPRASSTYSTVTDSGYSGMSRSQLSSDQWSVSYQYSTRSSLGSVLSENASDSLRKLSMDSASFYPCSAGTAQFDNVASDGSLQRRICRNLRTSFENEHSTNDLIGFVSDHYPGGVSSNVRPNGGGGSEGGCIGMPNYRRASYCANESRSNPEIGKRRDGTAKQSSRRAKLGLAVFITMSESFEEEMELFCSEHIALLESMLSRLRVSTERAYLNHKDFYRIMFQSWQTTQQWFSDLFTAPRIKCPVWLSITTSGSKYSKSVAECFMKEFCWLLSFADTKDTNFFISTMLTAILTHHLGWVSTVSAFNSSTTLSEASAVAIEQRAKLQQVSQKHPYNALWAQLGDLYGAIGMPPKLTRTVIYGMEKLSVERLLKILTYFIRCSEVRRSAKREDFNKDLVNALASQNKNETLKKSSSHIRTGLKKCFGGSHSSLGGLVGLTRTQTCKQNLNTISDNFNETENSDGGSGSGSDESESIDEAALVQNAKKNEIPNVLAFRDSRFVQQELRIGNYLMDTGIVKSSVRQTTSNNNTHNNNSISSNSSITKDGRIRFTVTTPDNIELHVEEETATGTTTGTGTVTGTTTSTVRGSLSSEDGAVEAIEIDSNDMIENAASEGDFTIRKRKSSFLWKMVPQSVKDGLSLESHGKMSSTSSLSSSKDCETKRICNMEKTVHVSDTTDRSAGAVPPYTDNINDGCHLEKRSTSYLSLSDLITQNSMGNSDRMTWGIEPIKEDVSLEEQIHFDYSQKIIEKEHGISRISGENIIPIKKGCEGGADSGVVFVLGDNEPLINIKKSTEDLVATAVSELSINSLPPSNEMESKNDNDDRPKQKQQLCSLHMQTYGPLSSSSTTTTTMPHSKKHSGVKFNFQEYPQIATNYMKSKNLVMSNYDLLMEKCTKLEAATAAAAATQNQSELNRTHFSLANEFPNPTTVSIGAQSSSSLSSATCIVCNGILNSYQTPSNATELEFETDEEHSYSTITTTTSIAAATNTNNNSSSRTLNTVSSATSIDTIKSTSNFCETRQMSSDCPGHTTLDKCNHNSANFENCMGTHIEKTQNQQQTDSTQVSAIRKQSSCNSTIQQQATVAIRKPVYSGNVKKVSSQRGSISSVAAKCAAVNEAVHLLKLPIPGIKELPQDEDPPDNMKLRAGFIPSLFLNVSDHYISDVVLQGTLAPPKKWCKSLREDLALSARSASLISLPVENIAIIADMENWDVRLISSQTQCFSDGGDLSAPVGMSQLVSSMLEAVQAMNSSGIPAYECLSFLESKLQEIYLQSETLAAFLLETDFCSLSAVTAALNLTENDVPLLLSIASIHTPQISNKCGISFRRQN